MANSLRPCCCDIRFPALLWLSRGYSRSDLHEAELVDGGKRPGSAFQPESVYALVQFDYGDSACPLIVGVPACRDLGASGERYNLAIDGQSQRSRFGGGISDPQIVSASGGHRNDIFHIGGIFR